MQGKHGQSHHTAHQSVPVAVDQQGQQVAGEVHVCINWHASGQVGKGNANQQRRE